MRSVTFQVPGKPQGKARARTFYNPAAGKHVSHTPDNTVLYENLIKDQFLNRADGFYLERGTPAVLRIVARFLPPKSTAIVSAKKAYSAMEGLDITVEEYSSGR